jgi:hypothetical protein
MLDKCPTLRKSTGHRILLSLLGLIQRFQSFFIIFILLYASEGAFGEPSKTCKYFVIFLIYDWTEK